MSAQRGADTPPRKQNHRQVQKHYLSATTVADGNYGILKKYYSEQSEATLEVRAGPAHWIPTCFHWLI